MGGGVAPGSERRTCILNPQRPVFLLQTFLWQRSFLPQMTQHPRSINDSPINRLMGQLLTRPGSAPHAAPRTRTLGATRGTGCHPASRTDLDREPCSGHPAHRAMCKGSLDRALGTRRAGRLRDGQRLRGSGQAKGPLGPPPQPGTGHTTQLPEMPRPQSLFINSQTVGSVLG